MSYDNQRTVIETRFQAQFVPQYPAIPVEYGKNSDFDEPADSTWVRLTINNGDSSQANLGVVDVTERYLGFVQCDIIVPKGSGEKLQNELEQVVGRIYARTQLSTTDGSMTFKTPQTMGSPTQIEEKSIMVVRIPFYRDQNYP